MLLIGTITVASAGRAQSADGSDGTRGGTKTLIELTREGPPTVVASATSTRRMETAASWLGRWLIFVATGSRFYVTPYFYHGIDTTTDVMLISLRSVDVR